MGNVNCARRQESTPAEIQAESVRNQDENCQSTKCDSAGSHPEASVATEKTESPSFSCEDIAEMSEKLKLGAFVFMGKKSNPEDHCYDLLSEGRLKILHDLNESLDK
ncbi:uncharacterized protein LOC133181182 [Saccostrea echinata]|uniref:uncharacterized protein LOC133181182 n=1 Tax=Saccostrea echinata TaxID=191078 RepID=UPI002A7F8863|nr:uncharacterized protein LOC133181182 [Saccostrea echinata]